MLCGCDASMCCGGCIVCAAPQSVLPCKCALLQGLALSSAHVCNLLNPAGWLYARGADPPRICRGRRGGRVCCREGCRGGGGAASGGQLCKSIGCNACFVAHKFLVARRWRWEEELPQVGDNVLCCVVLCGWPWLQPLRCAGGVWCSLEVEELPPVGEHVLPRCMALQLLGSRAMLSDLFKQWCASMCFHATAACCFPSACAGGRPGSAAWLGHLGGPAARAAVGHRCQAQGGPVSGIARECVCPATSSVTRMS